VRVLVNVPTYVEAENIEELLTRLRAAAPDVDILVIDDNSPDGTADIAERVGKGLGNIEVLRRPAKKGLGNAYRAGFGIGIDRGYDVICQMDADLSHDPGQLPDLIAATAHADVVIGSRYVPGGSVVNWPRRRRLLSRFANSYVRAVTRLQAHDCTSGYRGWRRTALASLPLDRFFSDGYSFLVEMLFVAARSGCRITEVPITFVERREGASKLSRGVILESAITPWRLVARPRRHVTAAVPRS
jgi:dolichol-phosphate mannosyltransferase